MALLRLTKNQDGTLATTAEQLAEALYGSGYTPDNLTTTRLWRDEAADVKDLIDAEDEAEALRAWLPVRRMVEQWAPSAPLDVQSEAALRLAGWIRYTRSANPAGFLAESGDGVKFRSTAANAFLKSGAQEALAPYRQHPVTVAGGVS